jgi:RND family efflux transporter MFP subunit
MNSRLAKYLFPFRPDATRPYHFAVAVTLVVAIGCNRNGNATATKEEPAHVAHHVEEQSLNTLTLTPKAVERLGITIAKVVQKPVQRRRTVSGEVVVPPGQTIVVSAPLAGTLTAPEGGQVPPPGSTLEKHQAVFRFTPLLTPERDVLTPAERVRVAQTRADVATIQLDAERQIETAKIQVEAAQIAYDRAVQLLENKAGSQRSVDEAGAALKLAKENLETARARHAFLADVELDENAGDLTSQTIESPVAGVLQTIDAAPAETVAAGDPLFSVVQTGRVWIRVPIYVGEWRNVATDEPAAISEYGQPQDKKAQAAQYVSAPPAANPMATSVDLYYELSNEDGRLYPGQKLSVTLPMQGRKQDLVVPFKAVLYDIHGGAWVYEEVAPHVYARKRVAVEFVDGDEAILAAGPPAGARIVTDGAAELFGTEFGVGH